MENKQDKQAESRTKKSVKNVSVALISQLVTVITGFVVRTIFIRTLSIEYLGINGLFTNILSMLSLAELGVGNALIYSMYKPMALNDTEKLKTYMDFYKKIYRLIGTFILVAGLSLTPFLNFFISDRPDINYLEFIYTLYVLNSVSTYFLAYKQSVFKADQKQYIINNYTVIFTLAKSIVQIFALLIFKQFIIYLIIGILFNYLLNYGLSIKANKEYSYLKDKQYNVISIKERNKLFKSISALFMHKLGGVVLNSSDTLILSKFVGIMQMGLYSNYSMIVIIIRNLVNIVFDSIAPSVGNLVVKGSGSRMEEINNAMLLLNVWLMGFCSIALYILLTPFVIIWLGEEYIINQTVILAIVVALYIELSSKSIDLFKSATGLFWNDRYVPFIQCIVNVIVSVILVQYIGMAGVFIGTSVALAFTSFWVQPTLVYKKVFQVSVSRYFIRYGLYSGGIIFSFFLTIVLSNLWSSNTIGGFAYKILCCSIVPNLIMFMMFYKTKEYNLLNTIVKSFIKNK